MIQMILFAALASAAAASTQIQTPPLARGSTVKQSFDHTITGQALVLPQGPVAVTVLALSFPAGFHGPWHKQPYPRYAYLLSGHLKVTYEDSGLAREFWPGEAMAEGIDQWHRVEAVGPEAVRIIVIDQTPPGLANVIIRQEPVGEAPK